MNILQATTLIVGEDTLKEKANHDDRFENIDKPAIINKALFSVDNGNWWKPSANGKKRIMLCGTYPIGTSNGYSKVVYYISKYLGTYDDIELTVYGFQNFANASGASIRNDIPANVKVHDAYATENPKRNGFGELEIGAFIRQNPQDVIIIFNDNVITSAVTHNIMNECGSEKKNFRLISYMDQVYAYQKQPYIELLNRFFDGIIAFTPYWAGIARKLGIRDSMPMYVFPHGFDEKLYFPMPTKLARMFYSFDQDAFMVLNLNRNQPRKQWSTCMIAWIEFVERHYQVNVKGQRGDYKVNKHTKRPIKLIVGTQMSGYWDLMDILENECKFRDVPVEYAKNTIQPVQMPQQLSDRDINILYNACDISVNSSDGEGWGLQGSECAGIGKGQVSAYLGGMLEYLNDQNSIPITPIMHTYGDNKSNGIGNKAELSNPHEYAEAFWKYLSNPELVTKHGRRGRENILTHYRWETMVEYFYKAVIPHL
jgi:glycosyltransferase involved in cell wall biosynthesis